MDARFSHTGDWILNGDSIMARGRLAADQCLYAFLVSGQSGYAYIGHTVRSIEERMQNIRNAGPTQPTNVRVKEEIIKALKGGKKVEIHKHVPQSSANLRALKAEFINELQPVWNIQYK